MRAPKDIAIAIGKVPHIEEDDDGDLVAHDDDMTASPEEVKAYEAMENAKDAQGKADALKQFIKLCMSSGDY